MVTLTPAKWDFLWFWEWLVNDLYQGSASSINRRQFTDTTNIQVQQTACCRTSVLSPFSWGCTTFFGGLRSERLYGASCASSKNLRVPGCCQELVRSLHGAFLELCIFLWEATRAKTGVKFRNEKATHTHANCLFLRIEGWWGNDLWQSSASFIRDWQFIIALSKWTKMCELDFCLLSWRNIQFNAINMFREI